MIDNLIFYVDQQRGVVFVNSYIPLHSSDVGDVDLELFFDFMEATRADFPGDEFILLGDTNVNRFPSTFYGNFRY